MSGEKGASSSRESVYDRLYDVRSYTGVYAERFKHPNGSKPEFRGSTNTRSDEVIRDISQITRPNLNQSPARPVKGQRRSSKDVNITIAAAGQGGLSSSLNSSAQLQALFDYFCKFGRTTRSGDMLHNANWAKFCRACPGLVDGRQVTNADIDVVFAKAKQRNLRRLEYGDFIEALAVMAEKKFPDSDAATAFSMLLAKYVFRCTVSSEALKEANKATAAKRKSARKARAKKKKPQHPPTPPTAAAPANQAAVAPPAVPTSSTPAAAAGSSQQPTPSLSELLAQAETPGAATAAASPALPTTTDANGYQYTNYAAAVAAARAAAAAHTASAVQAMAAAKQAKEDAALAGAAPPPPPALGGAAAAQVAASPAPAPAPAAAASATPAAQPQYSPEAAAAAAALYHATYAAHAAQLALEEARARAIAAGVRVDEIVVPGVYASPAPRSATAGTGTPGYQYRTPTTAGGKPKSAHGSSRKSSAKRKSAARKATLPGEGNKQGGVYERLADPRSFTGVYKRAWETDGRINAHADQGAKSFKGHTNARSNATIHSISATLRPNLSSHQPDRAAFR